MSVDERKRNNGSIDEELKVIKKEQVSLRRCVLKLFELIQSNKEKDNPSNVVSEKKIMDIEKKIENIERRQKQILDNQNKILHGSNETREFNEILIDEQPFTKFHELVFCVNNENGYELFGNVLRYLDNGGDLLSILALSKSIRTNILKKKKNEFFRSCENIEFVLNVEYETLEQFQKRNESIPLKYVILLKIVNRDYCRYVTDYCAERILNLEILNFLELPNLRKLWIREEPEGREVKDYFSAHYPKYFLRLLHRAQEVNYDYLNDFQLHFLFYPLTIKKLKIRSATRTEFIKKDFKPLRKLVNLEVLHTPFRISLKLLFPLNKLRKLKFDIAPVVCYKKKRNGLNVMKADQKEVFRNKRLLDALTVNNLDFQAIDACGISNLGMLKELKVIEGVNFCSNFSHIRKLNRLELINCQHFISLEIRTLKHLVLKNLENIERVTHCEHVEHFEVDNCPKLVVDIQSFINIKKMHFSRYMNLIRIWDKSSLQELHINRCIRLNFLKNLADLKILKILWCENFLSFENVPKLSTLTVENCPKLKNFEELPKLENLELKNCAQLSPTHLLVSTNLRLLHIENCNKIRLHDDINCFKNLEVLRLIHQRKLFNDLLHLKKLNILEISLKLDVCTFNTALFGHCSGLSYVHLTNILLSFSEEFKRSLCNGPRNKTKIKIVITNPDHKNFLFRRVLEARKYGVFVELPKKTHFLK